MPPKENEFSNDEGLKDKSLLLDNCKHNWYYGETGTYRLCKICKRTEQAKIIWVNTHD